MRGHCNEPLPRQTRFQAVLVQPALNVEQPVAGNDGDHYQSGAPTPVVMTKMKWVLNEAEGLPAHTKFEAAVSTHDEHS